MEKVLARQLSTGAEFNRQRLPGSDSGSLGTLGAECKCGMWTPTPAAERGMGCRGSARKGMWDTINRTKVN